MDASTYKYLGVGLMAVGMAGAAIGVGLVFSSLLSGLARNPSAADNLQRNALIGAGLIEAMGLFAFVIAMLIIFS
jgi:F-type H+-transporting ATPase subunit c